MTTLQDIGSLLDNSQKHGEAEGNTLDAVEGLIAVIRAERLQNSVKVPSKLRDFLQDQMDLYDEGPEWGCGNLTVPTLQTVFDDVSDGYYELDDFLDPSIKDADEAFEKFLTDFEALIAEVGGGTLVSSVLEANPKIKTRRKSKQKEIA